MIVINKTGRNNMSMELKKKKNFYLFEIAYFFDMNKLSEIIDPYGQVAKNLDFTLISYTIDPIIIENKLTELCNLSKSESGVAAHYFVDNAKRLTNINEIETEKMVIIDKG